MGSSGHTSPRQGTQIRKTEWSVKRPSSWSAASREKPVATGPAAAGIGIAATGSVAVASGAAATGAFSSGAGRAGVDFCCLWQQSPIAEPILAQSAFIAAGMPAQCPGAGSQRLAVAGVASAAESSATIRAETARPGFMTDIVRWKGRIGSPPGGRAPLPAPRRLP